ncbi:MFS transporter [Pseudomonas sp. PD9R]|uniref:MFS transporter n=1 Tax=Pseudomonas sp. PD9R TaxID=2853534 RepID=UPI001C48DBB1|nr:MFS transporter [Pseudomonas sp. PD9R]MBV6823136.1 MFS transporter [Pseudomonas sp. PD9R]
MQSSSSPGNDPAVYRRITWRIMPLLLLCYIVNYIDRVNIGIAKLQFSNDLGFSAAVFGLGAGLFFVGFLLFEVPSNLLLARIGARKTLLRIMLLWGLVSTLTMFVQTPWQFYTLRVLLGVAEAGFFPGIILYLSYWYPASRRGRITSLFFVGVPIAGLIGSPLSGWIMSFFSGYMGLKGWQWMFLLEGLPAMILGVVAFIWLDDRPANAKWLSDQQKQQVEQDLQLEQQAHAPSAHHSSLRLALQEPKLLVLGLISLCSYVLANTIAFFSPTIIHNSGITDVMHVGFLAAIPALVGIAAMLWVGRHSDRSGERRWHYALPLFAAALSLALLRTAEGNPLFSILLLSIASAGHFASLSVFWSIPPEVLSRGAAAAGIAIVSSIGALGGAIGPSLLGYITTATGDLGMALRVAAAIVAMGGVIMLLLFRRTHRTHLQAAGQES